MKMLASGLVIYLRIHPHWLLVRALPRRGEATQVKGTARVAVRQNSKGAQEVIAIGEEVSTLAAGQDMTVHDAFCHPRVLIGDFDKAQLVVGEFLRRACGGKRPFLRFCMVIHLPDELESGLSDVEKRAFMELGLGASRVLVSQEPLDLSDEQIVAIRDSKGGTS